MNQEMNPRQKAEGNQTYILAVRHFSLKERAFNNLDSQSDADTELYPLPMCSYSHLHASFVCSFSGYTNVLRFSTERREHSIIWILSLTL